MAGSSWETPHRSSAPVFVLEPPPEPAVDPVRDQRPACRRCHAHDAPAPGGRRNIRTAKKYFLGGGSGPCKRVSRRRPRRHNAHHRSPGGHSVMANGSEHCLRTELPSTTSTSTPCPAQQSSASSVLDDDDPIHTNSDRTATPRGHSGTTGFDHRAPVSKHPSASVAAGMIRTNHERHRRRSPIHRIHVDPDTLFDRAFPPACVIDRRSRQQGNIFITSTERRDSSSAVGLFAFRRRRSDGVSGSEQILAGGR